MGEIKRIKSAPESGELRLLTVVSASKDAGSSPTGIVGRSGQVLSSYTHVSDQHSTFGTKIIAPNAREAHFVLDDFLGNGTDLPLFRTRDRFQRPRGASPRTASAPSTSRCVPRKTNPSPAA